MNQSQVKVLVTDNGPGIPAHQRKKVFGRFVRLGNELERSSPGTGLGLYLVRSVTKSIGGTIKIRDRSSSDSKADDDAGTASEGTQFEVILRGLVPAMPDHSDFERPEKAGEAINTDEAKAGTTETEATDGASKKQPASPHPITR